MNSSPLESLQPTPNVILELMGINNIHIHQPHRRKVSVFSDDYFQRVDSIGVWKKCPERYSFNRASDADKEMEFVFCVLKSLEGDSSLKNKTLNRDKVMKFGEKKIKFVKRMHSELKRESLNAAAIKEPVSLKFDCGKSSEQGQGTRASTGVKRIFMKRSRFARHIAERAEKLPNKSRSTQSWNPSSYDSVMHDESELSVPSDTSSEAAFILSDDKDNGQQCAIKSVDNDEFTETEMKERQDFSYVVDMLIEAGFYGSNMAVDFQSDVSSSVFETLEKKYGNQIQWKKVDRMLLFDRVNSMLKELMQPSMGIPSWTKPIKTRFQLNLNENLIEDEIWRNLVCQEIEATKSSVKVLGKDDRWMDLVEEVQFIGKEVEQFLMDDLVQDCIMVIYHCHSR